MMDPYWFFLSYSTRNNARDRYVEKFFRDLALIVAEKAAIKKEIPVEEIGFFDQKSIMMGEEWPERLGTALQTSKVLICLYSPCYFESEYCGKEVQAFYNRLETHVKASPANTKQPPLIVPILWDTFNLPKPLPDLLADIQYKHEDLGDVYAEKGLSVLIKLTKFRDEYENLLSKLAEIIVKAAKEYHPLQGEYKITLLKEICSAFHQPSKLGETTGSSGIQYGLGEAKFVFVAGQRLEMAKQRKNYEFYGYDELRRDWQPYLGGFAGTIQQLAQSAAASEKLFCEPLRLDKQLLEQLDKAKENNNIVVVIVDPWTIQLEPYSQFMKEFDENSSFNSGVLIPWNKEDEETTINMLKLYKQIPQVFSHMTEAKTSNFKGMITSKQDLETALRIVLNEVRHSIISKGQPQRPVKSETPIPTVSASSTEINQ